MKRGDVVIIVASGELGKPRPAIVVQADELGETTTSVLICPITSETNEFRNIRPVVEPDAHNGLRSRSQIMTNKVSALRRDRIKQVIGKLDDDTSSKLDRALLVVFGLAR